MTPRPKHALLALVVLLSACGSPAAEVPVAPAATEIAATTPATEATEVTPEPLTTSKPAATKTTTKTKTKTKTNTTTKKTTATPKPTKKPTPKPTAGSGQHNVHPGAFCKPEGATGYTSKGTRMRCTRKAGEDQPRWRAA
jgi:hypothetical protein